jgi:hypothetical protein
MITSTSSIEQSSSITPSSKLLFTNTSTPFSSSQATTSNNSNSTGSTTGRYSPSHLYRAAAVAAVTSDPNNRRYMPSTPVCKKETKKENWILSHLSSKRVSVQVDQGSDDDLFSHSFVI